MVEGYVRDEQGQPVPGASIEVSLLKETCTDSPVPTVSDPDPVVTDVHGHFSGTFETLAAGPMSVPCMIIRARDAESGFAVETLVVPSPPEPRERWGP